MIDSLLRARKGPSFDDGRNTAGQDAVMLGLGPGISRGGVCFCLRFADRRFAWPENDDPFNEKGPVTGAFS
jgi:hypothetical protein